MSEGDKPFVFRGTPPVAASVGDGRGRGQDEEAQMIEVAELVTAIRLAEACPRPHPGWVEVRLDQPLPPQSAERLAFNAFLESLSDGALSDLHALMYVGRGDGSFIDMRSMFADDARLDKLRTITGKIPCVVAEYWRRAVKKHPEEA